MSVWVKQPSLIHATNRPCFYRPRLELLEARLPPGDLGLAAAWLRPFWDEGDAPLDQPTPASGRAAVGLLSTLTPDIRVGSSNDFRGTLGQPPNLGPLSSPTGPAPQPQWLGWRNTAGWSLDAAVAQGFDQGPGLRESLEGAEHKSHDGECPAGESEVERPSEPCGSSCMCGMMSHGTTSVVSSLPPPRLARPELILAGLQIRKNQADLTPKEIQAFVGAVKQLKNTFREGAEVSIYDEYVQAHILAMREFNIHDGPAFLPWHRAIVRSFELELQAINPDVTVPYWDFTIDNSPKASLWSEDFLGGNGDPEDSYFVNTGPFRQGEWSPAFEDVSLRRNFGGWFQINLPTPETVAGAFEVPRYDAPPYDTGSDISESFRNYVAGWNHPTGEAEMHNRVHEWMGGSMMSMASPNDPVFWLLHANIDRVWGQWQGFTGQKYEPVKGGPEGHNLYDVMPFVGVTPADMLDHRALGYDYAA